MTHRELLVIYGCVVILMLSFFVFIQYLMCYKEPGGLAWWVGYVGSALSGGFARYTLSSRLRKLLKDD